MEEFTPGVSIAGFWSRGGRGSESAFEGSEKKMQTWTHLLVTALVWDLLRRRTPPIKTGAAFLWGSVAPDIPLIGLTIGFWVSNKISGSSKSTFGDDYDELYFHNPFWIVLTSLFHAPFLLLFYLALGAALDKCKGLGRLSKAGKPLMWFALGCAFHTLLDIPTHAGDGPALLFPFEWHVRWFFFATSSLKALVHHCDRFNSPVSYWDQKHHGDVFAPIEAALDVALVLYFIVRLVQARRARRRLIDMMASIEVTPITERKSHRSDIDGSIDNL